MSYIYIDGNVLNKILYANYIALAIICSYSPDSWVVVPKCGAAHPRPHGGFLISSLALISKESVLIPNQQAVVNRQ